MDKEEQVSEIFYLVGLCATYLLAEICLDNGDPENEIPEYLKEAQAMSAERNAQRICESFYKK